MTSAGPPDRLSTRLDGPAAYPVRGPGELVAAVPVLLGFRPTNSLVLVGSTGGTPRHVGLTLRVDLPPPDEVDTVCRAAADALTAGRPTGADVVVVGGGRVGAGPPRPDVAVAVATALGGFDIRAWSVVWVPEIAAGSSWSCYGPCGCRGPVPDPASTAIAAAAVAGGRVIRGSRADLAREVSPADPDRLQRRDELLDRELAAVARAGDGDLVGEEVAGHRTVLEAAVEAAARGRLDLDDATVLALAAALRVREVHELALALCTGPRAAAAEQLWAALARETPDPEAAEPAALLALSALARGDGALANVALDRARQAWPGHRFSDVLGAAVAERVAPAQLGHWLAASRGSGDARGRAARGAAGGRRPGTHPDRGRR
jgi:hypothetical protein